MYTEHFQLTDLPFRLSPDPQFLYLSKHHARAKAYMESTIWFTDGFVVITGEIGAGKTTLIESFLSELDRDVVVAQINQTQVSANEFLQALLVQFGYQPFKMKKAELLATISEFLIEQHAAGRKVLLIVDEAQNLPLKVLEEVRMLSGVETTKEKVLRIILAGQPELNDKLDTPELVQLSQRIRLRFHLTSLSPEDLRGYVLHRLEVAGANGRQLFAEDTFPLLYRYTGGTPRLVNTLCETAMLAATVEDRAMVTLADVQAAIEELNWPEFEARTKGMAGRGKPRADLPPRERNMAPEGVAAPAPAPVAVAPRPSAAPARVAAPVHASVPAPLRLHADDEYGATAGDIGAALSAPGPRLVVTSDDDEYQVQARLVVAKEGRPVGELALRIGRTVVGRTPDNDLQIESRFISRHHCQILTSAEGCIVEDLGSTNGIVVGGRRVQRHPLIDGEAVVIGRHELRYFDERGTSTAAPLKLRQETAVAATAGPAPRSPEATVATPASAPAPMPAFAPLAAELAATADWTAATDPVSTQVMLDSVRDAALRLASLVAAAAPDVETPAAAPAAPLFEPPFIQDSARGWKADPIDPQPGGPVATAAPALPTGSAPPPPGSVPEAVALSLRPQALQDAAAA
jgi:type II secretory pathway predicted ATPase ExeA